jgi:hypothetical protein
MALGAAAGRRRAVCCDVCGSPLVRLVDAVVAVKFDHHDWMVEAGLDHRACAATEPEPGGRVETIAAIDFASTVAPASRLAALARLRSASVSRLVAKVAALAKRDRGAA